MTNQDFVEELRAYLGKCPLPFEPNVYVAATLPELLSEPLTLGELAAFVQRGHDQVCRDLRKLERRGLVRRLGVGVWVRS